MSIREFLNRNPVVTVVAAVILLGASGWVMYSQAAPTAPKPPTEAHFTTDDGATWFTDAVGKITPFSKDGKEAIRVQLFRCGKEEPVVGYLERYTTKGKEVVERFRAEAAANPRVAPPSIGEYSMLGEGAMEVRRPGDTEWVNRRDRASLAITWYKCSDGTDGTPVQVSSRPER